MNTPRGRGRPSATSKEEVERVAVQLFLENGYEDTTIIDIASAVGISKTSFFRYYSSKGAILWDPFDSHLERLDQILRARPRSEEVMTSVLEGVVTATVDYVDDAGVWLRRFELQGQAERGATESMHWGTWAGVISRFVRDRTDAPADSVIPETIGSAVQGAMVAFIRTLEADNPLDAEATLALFRDKLTPVMPGMQSWVDQA